MLTISIYSRVELQLDVYTDTSIYLHCIPHYFFINDVKATCATYVIIKLFLAKNVQNVLEIQAPPRRRTKHTKPEERRNLYTYVKFGTCVKTS